jgi:DNA (cytosine-5)-methyltransferase 1
MKILDLFSGIGGFSLGLERAGMQTIAFCEVDPACRQVLKKHWPDVPIFEDVKTLTAKDIHDTVDVICGGFPCQDISLAGKGAGLAGERSGLWYEYRRLIEEIRPRYVIIENVAALRSRGLDAVLSGLTEIGYDAEWHCIPASAVGAPHQRDRIWIVAYTNDNGRNSAQNTQSYPSGNDRGQAGANIAVELTRSSDMGEDVRRSSPETVADSSSIRPSGSWQPIQPQYPAAVVNGQAVESQHGRVSPLWAAEPDVGRVAHGVPKRVDRLKQLGNAVVPQIPELIGRAILAYDNTLA